MYKQDPEFRLFRKGRTQMEEQLKKRLTKLKRADEHLVAAIAQNTELEALLRAKNDELELGRAVAVEAAELRARVAALATELKAKKDEIDDLSWTASQEVECRDAHDMWKYHNARLVVFEDLLAAGRVSDVEVDRQ